MRHGRRIAVVVLFGLLLFEAAAQNAEPVYKLGTKGVTAPKVLKQIHPGYTKEARRAGIHGTVALSVVVGTNGKASDVRVLKSLDPGLDKNAVKAVQQWRFAPGTLRGKAVRVWCKIDFAFNLS
jgi:periplasmic protein TonB